MNEIEIDLFGYPVIVRFTLLGESREPYTIAIVSVESKHVMSAYEFDEYDMHHICSSIVEYLNPLSVAEQSWAHINTYRYIQ
jgi:hypothetical protein